MKITAAQTKAFFKANNHMAILRPTLLQIQNKVITLVDNLAKSEKRDATADCGQPDNTW